MPYFVEGVIEYSVRVPVSRVATIRQRHTSAHSARQAKTQFAHKFAPLFEEFLAKHAEIEKDDIHLDVNIYKVNRPRKKFPEQGVQISFTEDPIQQLSIFDKPPSY